MKKFIEKRFPYALLMIVGTTLFAALALECSSHYSDSEKYREKETGYLDTIQSQKETIFKKEQENEELQHSLDSIYGYSKGQ